MWEHLTEEKIAAMPVLAATRPLGPLAPKGDGT